ncbi:MAG: B12-binding domain-containing radical SAM protein [candidate division KSB1 bacterium]|nr:B12-binding domain-containing radical SAM protein [candidate division KSB1 bacterium]MDZ7273207.1 B12-binding domain-containing radical SAM protein [candidate division KSB1 bacterium]MDZ7285309.1 B12-binding domain-containing radical SAM protein [candidate division KSB1 bacterium]MDZ7298341.1 B12-binding domain-containing radical SAM protein [candidate division KSB1 bacterium]MDZ7349026.1 B12-binding domain-containing radical SAM protein [candidate division KSB1 bacterium]
MGITAHTPAAAPKVLLIQPPVEDFYQTSIRTLPVGLLYLAGALRQNGIAVEILDCQATPRKNSIPPPPEFAHLERYYQPGNLSPWKLYSQYRHYGLPWEDIREHIRRSGAEVIGISSLFTPFYREALRVAALAKEVDRSRPVILGGAHVNACPAQVLADPNVDFILLGEGERTLPALVCALLEDRLANLAGVRGIGYKVNGNLRLPEHGDLIEDLDSLPLPARELIEAGHYCLGRKRLTMLITSRGCPYHCTFCSIFLTAGRRFRVRSLHRIIDEMKLCRERLGIEVFDIEDDNFTFDQKRASRLLAAIREEFGPDQIELLAMNGLSAANLSENLLVEMKAAGFRALNLALVTNDAQRQRALKRPGATPHFDRIVSRGAALGFQQVNYLILGLPGATLAEMIGAIIHLMERPVLIGPSVFYATPGTASYEQCRAAGLLPSPELALQRSSCFPVETAEFSRRDLVTLFRLCRLLNFLKAQLARLAEDNGKTAPAWETVFTFPPAMTALPRPGGCYTFPRKLSAAEIGGWLAAATFCHRTFLGMRLRRRSNAGFCYQVYEEEFSPQVLALFLQEAEGREICSGNNVRIKITTESLAGIPHVNLP